MQMDSLMMNINALNRVKDGFPSIAYYIPKVKSAKQTYVNPDDFNMEISKFIATCMETDRKTPVDCTIMVKDAYNTMYFDLDWKWEDVGISAAQVSPEELQQIDRNVSDWFMHNIVKERVLDAFDSMKYDDNNELVRYTMMSFVPCENIQSKGGVHLFVYFTSNVAKYKNDVCNSLLAQSISCPMLNNVQLSKILDRQPLMSNCIPIPFAKKSVESRRYEYCGGFSTKDPDNYLNNLFIGSITHEESYGPGEEFSINIAPIAELYDYKSQVNRRLFKGFAAQLMDSLYAIRYFDSNNVFFEILGDHQERYLGIGRITYYFIRLIVAIECPDSYNDANAETIIFNVWSHWLMTMRKIITPEKSETEILESIKSNEQYLKSGGDFVKQNLWTKIACLLKFQDVKQFINLFNSAISEDTYNIVRNVDFSHIPPAYNDIVQTTKAYKTFAPTQYSAFIRQIAEIYGNFVEIYRCILSRLTIEVIPFDIVDGRAVRNMVIMSNSEKNGSIAYLRFMSDIMILQIFCNCIYKKVSTQELLDCICNFIKYFVYATEDKVYIYNVNQCASLCCYPGNQFIEDVNGTITSAWMKEIAEKFMKDVCYISTKAIESMCNKIYILAGLECRFPTITEFTKMFESISTGFALNGSKNSIRDIFRSRVSKDTTLEKAPDVLKTKFVYPDPVRIDENCPIGIFPTFYGFLRFGYDHMSKRSGYYYTTENFDYYSPQIAPVIYYGEQFPQTPHYKEAYEEIIDMFNTILPKEEERKYVMSQLACTLDSKISRNTCLLFIGSGGDGKTTVLKAMSAFLGINQPATQDEARNYIDPFNGTPQKRKPTAGFYATIKAAQLNARQTGHDSDFLVPLMGARFCGIEEAAMNSGVGRTTVFQSSGFKRITGEGIEIAREAYAKRGRAFRPNLIVAMTSNKQISFGENTKAIKRRLAIINTKTKFTSSTTELEKGIDNVMRANPMLADSLANDPVYADAIFYVLLDAWKNYVAPKYMMTSLSSQNIDKPSSIDGDTDEMLGNSSEVENSITMCLLPFKCDNLKPIGKYFIYSVYDIIQELKSISKCFSDYFKSKYGHEVTKYVSGDLKKCIIKSLNTKFACSFMKLDKRFRQFGAENQQARVEVERRIKELTRYNTSVLFSGTNEFHDLSELYQYFTPNKKSGTYYKVEIKSKAATDARLLRSYYIVGTVDIFNCVQCWYRRAQVVTMQNRDEQLSLLNVADTIAPLILDELEATGTIGSGVPDYSDQNVIISNSFPINVKIAESLGIGFDESGVIPQVMQPMLGGSLQMSLHESSSMRYSDISQSETE